MKVITICGSLKFIEKMQFHAERLELEGNCVLTVIYPTKEKDDYTKTEIDSLGAAHLKKIELSDAIFVVNQNGYIGESTKREIDYAKKLGKEIIFME
jgi:hypothetical protein